MTRNSPTTYFVGSTDEHQGVEYQLARGFAERLGVTLAVDTEDQFWRLLPDVESGAADIAAAGLQVGADRRGPVAYGPGYQTVEPLVVYRMGTGRPRSLDELMGGTLEVVAGSGPVSYLNEAHRQIPYLQWNERRDANVETLIRRVVDGDADYALVPSNEFAILQHYYPEARVAFGLGRRGQVAWALPANEPELREAVAAYFAEIASTGELDRILGHNRLQAQNFDFVGSRAFVRHLHERFPRYQAYFKAAAAETGLDWRLIAAIAYQESHWNEAAVSPTGVRGLMMLTEHSAEIVSVGDRRDAWESVLGGARYFRRVLDKFPRRIAFDDRVWLATAAYNIGFGHVEDARILTEIQGGNPDLWEDVRERLPLLADESWYSRVRRGYAPGTVPVGYVDNVRRYRALLDWMEGTEIVSVLDATPESTPVPGRDAAADAAHS